jgi:hypothetical protein
MKIRDENVYCSVGLAILILTVLVSAQSCVPDSPALEVEPTLEEVKPALEVKIEASKEAFKEGEPLIINVSLRNVGAEGVYLFRILEPEGLFVRFTVTNEQGDFVYQSPLTTMERTAGFLEDTFLLAPGYFWGRTFKLSKPNAHFSPGTYRIEALYMNRDADGKGGTLTGTFHSNRIEVKRLEAKESK